MSFPELIAALQLGIIYSLVSIGVYTTFRVINFADLTCDGSFVFGAAVSAKILTLGFSPLVSLVAGFFSGALAGGLTSILAIKFKITDLLAGILSAFMLYSINLKVLGGAPNLSLLNQRTIFSGGYIFPVLLGTFLLIWLCYSFFLSCDLGLALRAVGQNQILARSLGVKVNLMVPIGLILGNGFIGLSGALFSHYQGFVDVSQGIGTVIVGFASLIIGEKLFNFKNPFTVLLVPFFGAIFYRIIISFALNSDFLGFETQDLNLITGVLVVVFMSISLRRKYA